LCLSNAILLNLEEKIEMCDSGLGCKIKAINQTKMSNLVTGYPC